MESNLKHHLFGTLLIDAENKIDSYEEVCYQGRQITRFLYSVHASSLTENTLEHLSVFLTDEQFDAVARAALLKDGLAEEASTVRDFLDCHVVEIDLFNGKHPELAAFLDQIRLIHIGFFPDDAIVKFDYSIDPERSDELLVVVFDIAGEITNITWES